MKRIWFVPLLAIGVFWVSQAQAQGLRTLSASPARESATEICGAAIPQIRAVPPQGSGPVVYLIAPCLTKRASRLPVLNTYLRDIQLKPSQPSRGLWTPFDAAA